MIHLYVYGLVRDEGSVVLFAGEDDHRRPHMFAVDHRPAQDIVIALEEGEPVEVDIESWQVVGTRSCQKGGEQ